MIDSAQTELSIGFSEAERDDLENLIKAMRQGESSNAEKPVSEHLEYQMKILMGHVSRLSEIILKCDAKMKLLHEIICLFYEKSNKMDEQINFISRTKRYQRQRK